MMTCAGCGAELPPSSQPRKWCSDRCRRHTSYSGTCIDCGKPTYSGEVTPSRRCVQCAARAHTFWTREAIIGAIQAWADQTGGIPPTAVDWNPSMAVAEGRPEKAARFRSAGCYPLVGTVQRVFGSWSEAIRAAGFLPHPPGMYGREGEDAAVCQEIWERYEEGESSYTLASEYGVHVETIRRRILKVGGRMRPVGRSVAA